MDDNLIRLPQGSCHFCRANVAHSHFTMTHTYPHDAIEGGKCLFILPPSSSLLWNKVEGSKGQLSGVDEEKVGGGKE